MNFLCKLKFLVHVLSHLIVCCLATDIVWHTCREQRTMCLDSLADCNAHCRHDPHCHDRIDSRSCDPMDCFLIEFECVQEGKCISRRKVCDGKKDCRSGEDEWNCPYVTILPETLASTILISQKPATSTSKISQEPSTPATPISKKSPTSASPIRQKSSNPAFPVPQNTTTSANTTLLESPMSIDTLIPETSILTSAIVREWSCPDNYCMQNADCVVFQDKYHCKCPPSFGGERCELQLGFGQDAHKPILVASIVLPSVLLCLAMASVLIYLNKRSHRHSNIIRTNAESQMTLVFHVKE